jgi:hypothetical protein
MDTLALENLNILLSSTTLIGMGVALWKISSSISLFTSRVDNLEKEHNEVIIRIARMEARHELNENRINEIHVALAKIDGKIDYLVKSIEKK